MIKNQLKRNCRLLLISLIFFLTLGVDSLKHAGAAEPNSGIASTYTVEDKDIVDGDILCF